MADKDNKLTMTPDQLDVIVEQAVAKALRKRDEEEARRPLRRITNADLAGQAEGSGRQTQAEVITTAMTVGPVSHPRGKFADPPEYVVSRDFSEHSDIIDKLEALGYVVSLKGVDWQVRWEPTETQNIDGSHVSVKVDKAEPPEGASLIETLNERDPRNSRVFIQQWMGGKYITGEQTLDAYSRDDVESRRREAVASLQPGGQYSQPNIGHLDNADDIGLGAPTDGIEQHKL